MLTRKFIFKSYFLLLRVYESAILLYFKIAIIFLTMHLPIGQVENTLVFSLHHHLLPFLKLTTETMKVKMRLENTMLCSTHIPNHHTHHTYPIHGILVPGICPQSEKQESFIMAADEPQTLANVAPTTCLALDQGMVLANTVPRYACAFLFSWPVSRLINIISRSWLQYSLQTCLNGQREVQDTGWLMKKNHSERTEMPLKSLHSPSLALGVKRNI